MATSNSEWARFTDLLRAYVARRVSPDQVDDLVGDILLRLVRHQDQFTNADKPTAWMYRVASNAITDHYRRRGREERALSGDNPSDQDSQRGELSVEGTLSVGKGDHAEPLEELSACLLPFIETLPPRHREAIRLVDIDGLSQAEAANKLGLSVSGLKSRVQRGRQQLRQRFLNCCEIEFGKTTGIADWSPRRGADSTCEPSAPEMSDAETQNQEATPKKTCYPCQ